jgi:hypothetical protein
MISMDLLKMYKTAQVRIFIRVEVDKTIKSRVIDYQQEKEDIEVLNKICEEECLQILTLGLQIIMMIVQLINRIIMFFDKV